MPAIIDEHTQYVDKGGKPLVNGKLFIGVVNQDPKLNQELIFADRNLSVPLPNPQILDSSGRTINKMYTAGRYSIKLENSAGEQLFQDFDAGEFPGTTIISLFNVAGTNDITAQANPTITSYVDKQQYSLTIININTGAVTLNIDGVGAASIKDNGADIASGAFPENQIITVTFNSILEIFELVGGVNLASPPPIGNSIANTIDGTAIKADASFQSASGPAIVEFSIDGTLASNSDAVVPTEKAVKTFVETSVEAAILIAAPPGTVVAFAGSAAPTGWLLCDGATLDSTTDLTLASLFAIIGITYGGTGADDFNVPNVVDRFVVGVGNLYALGSSGGDVDTGSHTLTIAEMPEHSHPLADAIAGAGDDNGPKLNTVGVVRTGLTGGDGPHKHQNSLPPYIALTPIIKK